MILVVRQLLLHVLIPLVIGFLIYFFFRPDIWFIHMLEKRDSLIRISEMKPIQKFLIFSGPDFCWAYSLSSALFIWHRWKGEFLQYFPFLVFLLIAASELIQFFLFPHFIFDPLDVIATLSAFALSYLLNFRNVKNS